MRKSSWIVIALVLLLSLAGAVQAQDRVSGVAEMARYFPVNTAVFAAVRTDEAFFSQLDRLYQVAVGLAPDQGLPATLRDALNMNLKDLDTDVDTALSWLGDYAAFGVRPTASDPSGSGEGYLVVELADRAGLEAFMRSQLPADFTATTQGQFTMYERKGEDGRIVLSDDLLFVLPQNIEFPNPLTRESRLLQTDSFRAAVSSLPADRYDALIYLDPSLIPDMDTFPLGMPGSLALGATSLDGRALVLDIAQLPTPGAAVSSPARINPDFARFIPRNASAVIHATDLTALLNSLNTLVRTTGEGGDPLKEVERALRTVGINLYPDVLNWTTGDYALFYRLDIVPVLQGLARDRFDLNGRLDFGLVIEATDPVRASALAAKLGTLIQQFAANQNDIEIASKDLNGVPVTVIRVTAPLESPATPFNLELVLGASGDVFFLATRPAAVSIISGDGTLLSNPKYNEALRYALPDPTTVWFADGDGLLGVSSIFGIAGLAMVGPAVGNVFEEITSSLDTLSTPAPTATPPPSVLLPNGITPAMIDHLVQAVGLVSSGTISSNTTADGVVRVRLVQTYAGQ